MNRIVLSLLLCLSVIQRVQPKNCEELFWQAKNQYVAGDVQGALESYEKIEPRGWAVWYNMGICWYELQNPIQALAVWLKAQQAGGGFNPDLLKRIQDVRQQLGIGHQESWFDSMGLLIRSQSLRFWQIFVLATWLLLLVSYQLRRRRKLFLSFFIGSCANFFICITLLASALWLHRQKKAVVRENLSVYAGMHEQFASVGHVQAGQEVCLLACHDSWRKIQRGAMIGWIPAHNLIEV
jgi:hypothetical protein